nr:reverse transcriptase domain-containing protein [Tanacetum cinerariifolium]
MVGVNRVEVGVKAVVVWVKELVREVKEVVGEVKEVPRLESYHRSLKEYFRDSRSYDGRSTYYGGITPSTHRGYGDAIVIPAILVENFELIHGLLNLVTSKQIYGFEKEDLHAHIRCFNNITSTIKYRDVPKSSIKLMLFPFSIEGQPGFGSQKKPPRSILTWEDLVSKFINQFFPSSKTTNIRNEITNFQQRFDESFCDAWYHFKELLRACPHHGFTKLHQLDTFYNALTPTNQDSLHVAAGGNLLTKTPRDGLTIIENKSKVQNSRNKPVATKKSSPPASVKAVEEICVTYGGPHPYHQCLATDGNVFPEYRDNI